MARRPLFLMTDPDAYDVRYRINPWMRPDAWRADPDARRAAAQAASAGLRQALAAAGAEVRTIGAVDGLPDLVFPANAAVVLDGRVLLARFRHAERQGEEAVFRRVFAGLRREGLVSDVVDLPAGLFHEGAGDCVWDERRRLFWAGHGPRSSRGALAIVRGVFGQEVQPLELATERFYHLDTCFCPLAGGEVLYHPPAFTPAARAAIRAWVPEALRVEASDEEAAAFSANAIGLGRTLILARAPQSLREKLQTRGYRLVELDLAPFILAGGGAYCLTLRLDRSSRLAAAAIAAE